ncbi:PREDICTED: uncharacterized protein LOC108754338 isoform X1 [Trachymyrmex septentrionalis]|uniref:uncharacterized protein LOC108754338 isoform X1 n=2 Tax=Trachymyrmex septentrionalis TaxID=34720 RepID=UPI00084F66FB|nr:PREDICTED: uncharacterized protein LOC108754338 isoform X1 [Trachymyrmex septentrionalis]
MLNQKAVILLLIIQICILQTISHAIDVRDTKVFEIALDDVNYDEENENEMIQPVDLADLKSFVKDESKYEPLHSHVKYYNELNARNKNRYSDILLLQPRMKEIFNLEQENKPFIAGFKHNLDKNKRNVRNFERLQNYRKDTNVAIDKSVKSIRIKREEITNHYGIINKEMDFFQVIRDRNITTSKTETTEYFVITQEAQYNLYEYDQKTASKEIKITLDQFLISKRRPRVADKKNSHKDSYDEYNRLKMEYEQQLEYDIKEGKVLNYSQKESKDMPKEALKRLIDLKRSKNCTKKELSQIGIKAIECLLYDFQRTKDIMTAKMILSRTWLVLRIWLLIYISFAIPCWCQRGWCCCCFRCKFCFPRKRIMLIKQYYAMNPPGIFVKDLKKVKEPVKYEPTEYEYNTYKTFETAIRNI